MRYAGYDLVYLPVPLAAGVCPAAIDLFMRQQYRWCCGATSLVWTRTCGGSRCPGAPGCRTSPGWLWNLTTALRTLILPFIPITLLVLLPGESSCATRVLLIPVVVTGVILYPLWHNSRWSVHIWPLCIAVGWAQVLAIWDYAWGRSCLGQPSRGPRTPPAGSARRCACWNGTLAIAWVGLAAWRIEQTMSVRFAVVGLFGLANLAAVLRVVFPGKECATTPAALSGAAWQG